MSDECKSSGDDAIAGGGLPGRRIRLKAKSAKTMTAPLRLVLDTNVWLDWLVFDDPDVAPVKAAVAAGRAEVFIDEATEAELARVLAYRFGGRTLTEARRAACMEEFRRISRRHDGGGPRDEGGGMRDAGRGNERGFREACLRTSEPANARRDAARRAGIGHESNPLPRCGDPDDQKFLDLALACGAAFLVTRDRDLLELARHRDPLPPFRIVTPRQFQGG